jgi:mannonate dehydratase
MKRLEQTWRWFGPQDPVTLAHIRQAGATGIVTALHHIPNGLAWPVAEIQARKAEIEAAGLRWSVVESLPVSEDIKRQRGDWQQHLQCYRESLHNLADCGIYTVTYNFMPVLDWTRTQLDYTLPSGAKALRFEWAALAAFDCFLLQRPDAEQDYTDDQLHAAEAYYAAAAPDQLHELERTMLAGLPGAEAGYALADFRRLIATYDGITPQRFRQHLAAFLEAVIPTAAAAGMRLAIHPDDPPFSIFGLPRILCTAEDVDFLLQAVDSPANGLCFCTGSFGARPDNDLPAMASRFAERIHFAHLRSTQRDALGNFHEADHLAGDVDMWAVMKALLEAQQQRPAPIPFRPDHGHQMLDDLDKPARPGYTAIGRLRGLAELRGLEWGVLRAYWPER